MKFGAKLIVAAGLSMLPAVSYGQSYSQPAYPRTTGRDVAYCQVLSNTYVRYVGHDWQYGNHARFPGRQRRPGRVDECQSNPAFAIPVLERELSANKITLPVRG